MPRIKFKPRQKVSITKEGRAKLNANYQNCKKAIVSDPYNPEKVIIRMWDKTPQVIHQKYLKKEK